MFYKLPEFIRLEQASSPGRGESVDVCVCYPRGGILGGFTSRKIEYVCVCASFSHDARGVEWKYRKRIHRRKNNNEMILANNVKWHMCGSFQRGRRLVFEHKPVWSSPSNNCYAKTASPYPACWSRNKYFIRRQSRLSSVETGAAAQSVCNVTCFRKFRGVQT